MCEKLPEIVSNRSVVTFENTSGLLSYILYNCEHTVSLESVFKRRKGERKLVEKLINFTFNFQK